MFNLDGILKAVHTYFDTKVQSIKSEVQQKLILIFTFLILFILILFFSLMMIAFFGLAIGFYLNYIFDSSYLGFLIMAFVFLGLIIITILSKNILKNKIRGFASSILNTN